MPARVHPTFEVLADTFADALADRRDARADLVWSNINLISGTFASAYISRD
jgi:hypothetical protein